MAEQYLNAHHKKLSTKRTVARKHVKTSKFAGSGSRKDVLRCFARNGRGHRAVNCSSRASMSQNELNSRFCPSCCYKCALTEHNTKDSWNLSQCTQLGAKPGCRPTQQQPGGPLTQYCQITSEMQVSQRTDKEAATGMDTLE